MRMEKVDSDSDVGCGRHESRPISHYLLIRRSICNISKLSQVKSSQVAFNAVCQAHTGTMKCN